MSKQNIIQRRELEPLMLKANKIVKHYEKAASCRASVTGPELKCETGGFFSVCGNCKTDCDLMHTDAVSKSRQLGGSYIYQCNKEFIFWTSPFYSGERFAGALLSGGIKKTAANQNKIKALAQLLLLCADQISGKSFVNKNISSLLKIQKHSASKPKNTQESNLNSNEIQDCPLEMERKLLASLRRGDDAEGQKILNKLIKTINHEVNNNFPAAHRIAALKLKAIELAVLLSRAASDPEHIKDNTALDITECSLKKIEESATIEEITGILSSITERMSEKIFSFHGVRHFSAIRKAERYIWTHYTRKLSLKEIANASGLSAPYFSTVFKEEMGENLSNYLNRLRIEKAAAMLLTTNLPISEVARTCGFEDQSWFSKIFKNNTNLTPGKYREYGITADEISAISISADGLNA